MLCFRYPDFVAVAVVIVLTVVVGLGVKCFARFSAVFVVINISVLIFVTICGIAFGHTSNWTAVEVKGMGGSFMPFGWTGMLAGAASCFWALSGFELISYAVEESSSPQRHIPIATLLTVLIVTALYIGTSMSLTLLIPYQLIDTGAPLPSAFVHAGLTWSRYVVMIGPLCGFTTAFISNTYGFVRLSLAMAEDGLLWSWFASVNEYTKVPVLSVILSGVLQSLIACFFDIRDLISFNVNLLLLAYSSTCLAVVVLRYSSDTQHQAVNGNTSADKDVNSYHYVSQNSDDDGHQAGDTISLSHTASENNKDTNTSVCDETEGVDTPVNGPCTGETASVISSSDDGQESAEDRLLPYDARSAGSTSLLPRCGCLESFMICRSDVCVKTALAFMLMAILGLAFLLIYGAVPLESGRWWSIVLVVVLSCGVAVFLSIICIHRQTLQTAVLVVSGCSLVYSMYFSVLMKILSTFCYICCHYYQYYKQTFTFSTFELSFNKRHFMANSLYRFIIICYFCFYFTVFFIALFIVCGNDGILM